MKLWKIAIAVDRLQFEGTNRFDLESNCVRFTVAPQRNPRIILHDYRYLHHALG